MTATAMHQESRLIEKYLASLPGERVLVVGCPGTADAALLDGLADKVSFFDWSLARHDAVVAGGQEAFFGTEMPEDWRDFDAALVYIPKGKDIIAMTLSMVADRVKVDGSLFLVGHNNAGIKSAKKALEEWVGPVLWKESSFHCTVFEAKVLAAETPFALRDWAESTEVAVPGLDAPLTLCSYPGVFSHGRLDVGTALLLDNLPKKIRNRVLDFGCGCGVIGAVIKTLSPETMVTAVDNNAFAIRSCQETLAQAGLTAEVQASNVYSRVSGTYHQIVSNPPFHTGVKTDYTVVEQFFTLAKTHLTRDGELRIVANRHLPYQQTLEHLFPDVMVVAENNGFRVLSAVNGRRKA